MKTLIAALAAVTAVTAVAAPAAAQPGRWNQGGYEGAASINQRQQELQRRIDIGLRTRELNPREARSLQAGLRDVDRLQATYRSHGFDRAEVRELDRRMSVLERQLAGSLDRRYGYGYGRR